MSLTLLFGGSFDPVHHGHLITAARAAEEVGAPRVLLVPAAVSPHKTHRAGGPPSSGADRLAMLRAAVAAGEMGTGRRSFVVSEMELLRPPPSYTVDTVEALRKQEPGEEFVMLIGADQLPKLHTWERIGDLLRQVRVAVLGRPGSELDFAATVDASIRQFAGGMLPLRTPLLEISATDIRARVKAGLLIAYLVPEGVAEIIRERGLYRG